jgi:hypothetical protein
MDLVTIYFARMARLLAALTLALVSLAPAQAEANKAVGPLSLIVTYHTTPANRSALLHELEGAGVRQFQRWQEEGVLGGFQLLFNRYADSDNMDAIALLNFRDDAAASRWKAIERNAPGGLTKAALALVTGIHTAPADLERGINGVAASGQSVFMVIPYETLISAPEYLKYADGYAIPQFDGWIAEGILAGYGLYVNRYAAGRPWSTLLVLEYRSDAALGQREAVVNRVRTQLKNNPEWRAISENKKTIRNEKQVVVADPIMPHPAH